MSARSVGLRSLVWLCTLGGVALLVCCAPALAARGHVFGSTFGSEGSGEGQFKEPSGVAVNESTGNVYVVDGGNDRVEYFSSTGTYLGQFNGSGLLAGEGSAAPTGQFSKPEGIAVDNSADPEDPSAGDVYVVDAGHVAIDKFSSTGAYIGQLTEATPGVPFKELFGVGVDAGGGLWVYYTNNSVFEGEAANFDDTAANGIRETRQINGTGLAESGFAVDSEGGLYAHNTFLFPGTDVIEKFDSHGKTLNQAVDTEPPSAVAVEASSNDSYIDNFTTVGRFTSNGVPLERLGAGHLLSGSGIGVSSLSETIYVADSAADVVDIFPPEPPSKPTVETESVSNVTGNSATFGSELNPRGASTEYHFEYGSCTVLAACATSGYEKSVPVPDVVVGSGFAIRGVSVHLQDLLAGTVYHFRVVAHNEFGTTDSVERTFTTQTLGGGLTLPDDRAWEMVSPPDKQGAQVYAIGQYSGEGAVIQASASGSAMTYLTSAPTEVEPLGYTNLLQALSTRGSAGWGSRDIAIAHERATNISVGEGEEYRFFSEDLSLGALQPFGAFMPSLSDEASEQTPYLRTDFLNGDAGSTCTSSCYRPLVTGAPGHANVPFGTAFGEEGKCPPLIFCGPTFLGATSDLSHVVLESGVALTTTSTGESRGLYEWSGGKLALISVLPGGEVASGAELGLLNTNVRHAISDDGSRVVWSVQGGHLYVRDTTSEETVQLDAVQGGSGEGGSGPHFQIASSDGSRVFFTDTQMLTPDAGSGNDLYECDIVEEAGELKCKLTDLTPAIAGKPANVQGGVLGASEDGSSVYFVAEGVLAAGAVLHNCNESPLASPTCNLYVHRGGVTRLVGVLSGVDIPDWEATLSHLTARVSPDGRWLAFMSQRELTGYNTHDAVSGKPDEEVYLYDAAAGAGSGRLVCASCNPSGARPVGTAYGQGDTIAGGDRIWGDPLAANIPGWTPYNLGGSLYQSRYLSDSGRLFFNSNDALVPQDVNGTVDVYQYESPGVGGCSTSSLTFSERSEGCVGLISSGDSAEESGFMDASATGGDVFFLTTASLSGRDRDTALDIYDAHECTSNSPCFALAPARPPACSTGDGCKPSPSPQPESFGSPASATFSGAGNVASSASKPTVTPKILTRAQQLARALRACRAKKGKRRATCRRQARARYAAKQSSRANATKRGGR